jgi:hypothetical protein
MIPGNCRPYNYDSDNHMAVVRVRVRVRVPVPREVVVHKNDQHDLAMEIIMNQNLL